MSSRAIRGGKMPGRRTIRRGDRRVVTMFVFLYTATLAAIFLIVTGLIGYQPPAHLSLDPATWRHGVWRDDVIVSQLLLGVVLLSSAAVVAVRMNRHLSKNQ